MKFPNNVFSLIAHDLKETDVNQVCVSQDRQVLAVADNFGPTRIFYYPTFSIG